MVTEWLLSEAFDGATLSKASDHDWTWTSVPAERSGITNISSVRDLNVGADTVYARHVIRAEKAGHKLFTFGYSDKASVYLNGDLIYKGNNGYLTRDYRYLGTIGMFDSIVLPLKKGDNELWIAVTEAFGGWGIMGQLSDSQ
jgi:hypothetical protein